MASKKEVYVETDISKLKCWGKIQNQQIPHILITPSFKCAILCYSALAIILAGFGALCYTQAKANNDLLIRYDDACNGQAICTITFTPTVDLVNPKIYYQLENFYANHRNFVKSRNYKQLRGNIQDAAQINGVCDPVLYVSDLGNNIPKIALDGSVLSTNSIAYPCGLILDLNLQAQFQNEIYKLYFEHSDTCPNRIYRQFHQLENPHLPIQYSKNNYKLAVCITLSDSQGKILLTRRNSNMKIFPNAWVLPGGHVDPQESLEHAVVRELQEETGIQIDTEDNKAYYYKGKQYKRLNKIIQIITNYFECELEPYYAFESVSTKVFNAVSPPQSCHVIVFFKVQLPIECNQIELKMSQNEIDAAVWIHQNDLSSILQASDTPTRQIEGILVGDSQIPHSFDSELFQPPYPNKRIQGISKAHNFALRYYLKQNKGPKL